MTFLENPRSCRSPAGGLSKGRSYVRYFDFKKHKGDGPLKEKPK
jgi:hypothetical protein